MDVVEDDVVRRRRHIHRRSDVSRHRHEIGLRQDEQPDWGEWRRQHHKIRRWRRQEEQGRRRGRRKGEFGITEIEYGPIDVDELVCRRRRQVVVDHRKCRRRLERSREDRKAPAGIPRMRPARIAPQIGPIGIRRIGEIGAAPGDRLTPRGEDRPHSPSQGIAGIGDEKILIALHGVARESRGEGVLRAKIAHRPLADCGDLIRGALHWRCIGRAIEEGERHLDFLRIPRDLPTLGVFADAQAQAIKNVRQQQAAGADHFRQRLRVDAVGSGLAGCDSAGRGVERDQRVRRGIDQRKAAGDRVSAFHERLLPRGIEHEDAGLQRRRGEVARIVAHAQAFDRNVGVAVDR